jgi:hypothetical protein
MRRSSTSPDSKTKSWTRSLTMPPMGGERSGLPTPLVKGKEASCRLSMGVMEQFRLGR